MPRTDTRLRTQAAKVVPSEDRYYARRPFLYAGTELARGQVFSLAGAANDEKLIRMRYIEKVESNNETYECGECGCVFVHMGYRDTHGAEAHRRRQRAFANPAEEDAFYERQDAVLQREAPLALEKTLASQRAS